MNGHRSLIGLSLLCALVFSALAAQSASAAGTTAFTCKPGSGKGFTDEHCEKAVASGASFVHEEIAPGTSTEAVSSNLKTKNETKEHTSVILTATISGVFLEISCTKASATGKIENVAEPAMHVVGTSGEITYTECKVPKPATENGTLVCKVNEPIVANASSETVAQEKATVKGAGASELFTEITIENNGVEPCNIAATYPIKGSVTTKPAGPTTAPGATMVSSGEGTLKIGASAAKIFGTGTGRMSGAGGNPISLTRT